MRWLAAFVLLAGCVRARVTAVHPTQAEHTASGAGSGMTIARTAPASEVSNPPADTSANLVSVELGALVPFRTETANVHIAPGVRMFSGQGGSILWGTAVGADFFGNRRGPWFALEGSIFAGNSSNDRNHIVQALDLFTGVTVHSKAASSSIAIGPSLGILGLPGGHSNVIVGLGIRLTGGSKD